METERLLTTDPYREFDHPAYVNSDTFTNFLIGPPVFPAKQWKFAPRLDLQIYEPFMRTLSLDPHEVYDLEKDIRENWIEMLQTSGMAETDYANFISRKVRGEKSMVVYYDYERGYIHMSPVIRGEKSSVAFATGDLYFQDKLPLLELHSHPDDSMLSMIDYVRMLYRGYTGGRGMVRGCLVLCPSLQILALPTPETPIQSVEETNNLIEQWEKRYSGIISPLFDKKTRKINRVQRILGDMHRRASEDYSKVLRNLRAKLVEKEIDEAEAENIAKQQQKSLIECLEYHGDRIRRLAHIIHVVYENKIHYGDTVLLMEFARALHTKLYFSHNMKDFKEFSA